MVLFVFWKLVAQSGAAWPAPGLLGLKYQIKLSATPYYFSWATACQPAAGSDGWRNWGDNNHQSQPTIRPGPGPACWVRPLDQPPSASCQAHGLRTNELLYVTWIHNQGVCSRWLGRVVTCYIISAAAAALTAHVNGNIPLVRVLALLAPAACCQLLFVSQFLLGAGEVRDPATPAVTSTIPTKLTVHHIQISACAF